MEIEKLLKLVVAKKASDLFITAGFPPSVKQDGRLVPITKTPLNATEAKNIVLGLMNDKQKAEFQETLECNFAINKMGIGRFRVSAFQQRNQVGMVLYQSCFLTTVMSMGSWTTEQGGMTSNSRAIARNSNAELKFR